MNKEVSPTNSPIGSQHWFNTLLGSILHMGEYIAEHEGDPARFDLLIKYGKQIEEDARHLMDNYAKIAAANLDEMGQQVAQLLDRITLVEKIRKPATMLMLEILHECPDTQEAGYEYTEAWPYADTETGLKSATAAIYADIERCKEDEDEENGGCAAPFQHARIYRCTLNEHGAYADGDLIVEVLATDDAGFLTVSKAEHSEVDGSKPEIALEVGKKYWTRDKHIAQVDYHNTSNGIFSGYIRGGLQNVSWLPSGRYWGSYTDYPLDLIAEYKEQTP